MRIQSLSLFFFAFLISGCGGSSSSNEGASDTSAVAKDTTKVVAAEPVAPAPNTLTDAEKSDGWQLLFDGSDTVGWHVYNHKSNGSAWKIVDGTLHLDPAKMDDWQVVGGGDIISDKEFENFDFKAEWKIADSGNSGIMFYVQEDPKYKYAWYTGPELQVLDNGGHPDAKIVKHRAGDLYDLITSIPETVKGPNQWNQIELICKNGQLEFFLNGTKVITTTMWDDNWKKMIAGSKFKSMKGFGTFKKGHFALQDHGFPVWYRNIKVKSL